MTNNHFMTKRNTRATPSTRKAFLAFSALLIVLLMMNFGVAEAADTVHEGAIPAAKVADGIVVFEYKVTEPTVVTGFYARLANCVGPRTKPTIVGLRHGGELKEQRVAIPVYGTPLNMYTRIGYGGRVFPPLDVGQEYRVALPEPVKLKPGETVSLEVISTEPLVSGVTAGIQTAGTWPLLEMRDPFRVTKSAGPVCRVAWSERELVCMGNQKKYDPLCAPQNNSGVITDSDGSLYQFTAYYSVDEQYGGGRAGAYSRIYGFKKKPGEAEWKPLGLILDPVPAGLTYCGDPFVLRDLKGRPCLVYTTADGTNGFLDYKKLGAWIIRSKTDSFEGPWGEPHPIFKDIVRSEVGRVNCLRVYPRPKTNDYLIVWLHGSADISYCGVIVPSLDVTLTKKQVENAVTLTRNQEEGGGGFVRGDKGYLTTWQIPSINDSTSVQRLYEFDLNDPLNPEKWVVVPGSWGWNDGTNPLEDGGATADSWALSYLPESDTLWASAEVWSTSLHKNSTIACSVPWKKRLGETFHFGCPTVHREICPVVEYAVGRQCSLSATITGKGKNAIICFMLAPSNRPQYYGGIAIEVDPKGMRLVANLKEGEKVGLTPYQGKPFIEGKPYQVKLSRDGNTITAWVDGQKVGPVTITDPTQKSRLDEPQRFKFYSSQGCLFSVEDAMLVDGPER